MYRNLIVARSRAEREFLQALRLAVLASLDASKSQAKN